MNVSMPKLKAVILYFAENTNPQYLGKVKLMKLLYFLDFQHVKRHGAPVLGDQYYHLPMGPVPTVSKNLVDDLITDPENAKLADTIAIETPPNTQMQKIVPLRKLTKHDLDLFTPAELAVLEDVAKRFHNTTADSIIAASHEEAPWRETEELQEIPYELAADDPDSSFTKDDIKFLNSL